MKNVLILITLLIFISLLPVACGKKAEPLPEKNLCFETNILPLVKKDCAFCHWHGEYFVQLRGEVDDYDTLKRYIDVNKVGEKGYLLSWASGYKKHPILWRKDSPSYNAIKTWIMEGSKKTCSDSTEQTPQEKITEQVADAGTNDEVIKKEAPPETQKEPIKETIKEKIPEPKPTQVSFAKDIAPLIATSCWRCHRNGGFGVKLQGSASDYSTVMRYVNKQNPGASNSFLWWCADAPRHQFWSHSGSSYKLTLKWIQEGAKNN